MQKLKNKNILYIITGVVLIGLIIFLLIQINAKKIDEQWKTNKITITLADGTEVIIDTKETVNRISRLCNDGLFRTVPDENKVDGNCEIWIDFNNGTIIGMFLNRDYGYVGNSKQYIGESMYLPNGLNEFIKNIISQNATYVEIQGEILENKNLGYLLKLDEDSSKKIIDTEEVFVSYENLPFTKIKDLNFKEGDIIKVRYNGYIIESFPPTIYCSELSLVSLKEDLITVTPVIKEEDLNEGYQTKLLETEPIESEVVEENTNGFKFEKISLSDTSISNTIPNWVMGEMSLNSLYSISNSDYLVDTLAQEAFANIENSNWTEEQVGMMVLGQGIKCFNMDSDEINIYYPIVLNKNIVALLQMKEENDTYVSSVTLDFINGLNEVSSKTTQDSPLILIKKDNCLAGMIEDVIYCEENIDINNLNLEEISGETVVDVLEELIINEIPESLEN